MPSPAGVVAHVWRGPGEGLSRLSPFATARTTKIYTYLGRASPFSKCEVAHTSFRLAPLKSGMATIWRQEGHHGTNTRSSYARICLRDSSCGGGHHLSDHDA